MPGQQKSGDAVDHYLGAAAWAVLMTGRPLSDASSTTLGNASKRESRAKHVACENRT